MRAIACFVLGHKWIRVYPWSVHRPMSDKEIEYALDASAWRYCTRCGVRQDSSYDTIA